MTKRKLFEEATIERVRRHRLFTSASEADKAIAALDAMCAQYEQYEQCHSELLKIHEIACCGWANVLRNPIAPGDTLTVRAVKIMALELMKDRPTPETPNVKFSSGVLDAAKSTAGSPSAGTEGST